MSFIKNYNNNTFKKQKVGNYYIVGSLQGISVYTSKGSHRRFESQQELAKIATMYGQANCTQVDRLDFSYDYCQRL